MNFKSKKKEIINDFKVVLKSKYFYISLVILAIGVSINILSQIYLHNVLSTGKSLPILSDLILDNIPYLEISWMYDTFSAIAFIFTAIYVIHKRKIKSLPYFIFLFGIFMVLRGVFVILTPFGNPVDFKGSKSIFNGFAKYDLGLYPSGHTGSTFLYALFAKGIYRWIIGFFCLIIIISLFLARGHYSIDIISGILFSYAIYCFGKKYLTMFKIK